MADPVVVDSQPSPLQSSHKHPPLPALGIPVEHSNDFCGELSTGEYHAQYERGSGWVWTGGLEARQGVATQDWGFPPDTTLKQNSKREFHQRRVRSWGSTH